MARVARANDLERLAALKEKEWKDINEHRIKSLDLSLKQAQKTIEQQNVHLRQLQDDFKFNLKLLEERDLELERYDQVFALVQGKTVQKDAEISDLKVQLDKLDSKLKERDDDFRTAKERHRGHVLQLEQELDDLRARKNADSLSEREKFEKFKRGYQQHVDELAEDVEKQRRELTGAFEEALQRREHEFRLELDQINALLHRGEQQVKSASRELQLLREEKERKCSELDGLRVKVDALEKALRDKEWDLGDVRNVSNARWELFAS